MPCRYDGERVFSSKRLLKGLQDSISSHEWLMSYIYTCAIEMNIQDSVGTNL